MPRNNILGEVRSLLDRGESVVAINQIVRQELADLTAGYVFPRFPADVIRNTGVSMASNMRSFAQLNDPNWQPNEWEA